MPEAPGAGARGGSDEHPAGDRVLLVMIVASPKLLDEVITGMLDIGVAGTVVEAKGLMSLLREEMPIFGGLASMMPQNTGSRVVLSVASRERASGVLSMLMEEFKKADRPIAFTVPLEQAVGMRN